jgi:gluconolactonase
MSEAAAAVPEIPIERFEVFATGLDHPECVAFDREGNLWAGGEAGQVYRIDLKGRVETIATLGGFTGGIAFSPVGELIVCNPSLGLVRVHPNGKHELFAGDVAGQKWICPNYPVFDRHGNLYVTESGKWKQNNGCIARYTPDGRCTIVAGPLGYANGLALSGDGRTLFMAESDTRRIWRFNVASDGSLNNATVVGENVGRLPDGLALDECGNLYVACYASDDIHRIAPDGQRTWFAHDSNGINLGRPTNIAFGVSDVERNLMYVANLGRYTVVRVRLDGVRGQLLASHAGRR